MLKYLVCLFVLLGVHGVSYAIGNDTSGEAASCVLEVKGKRFINGPCPVVVGGDGRVTVGSSGTKMSSFWAMILPDDSNKSRGEAFWNESPGSSHAHARLGDVYRSDNCWINSITKICFTDFKPELLPQKQSQNLSTVRRDLPVVFSEPTNSNPIEVHKAQSFFEMLVDFITRNSLLFGLIGATVLSVGTTALILFFPTRKSKQNSTLTVDANIPFNGEFAIPQTENVFAEASILSKNTVGAAAGDMMPAQIKVQPEQFSKLLNLDGVFESIELLEKLYALKTSKALTAEEFNQKKQQIFSIFEA